MRALKSLIIAFFLSVFLLEAHASAAGEAALPHWVEGLGQKGLHFPAESRWKAGDPFTAKTRDGTIEGQLFERVVNLGIKSIPVGTVTFLKIPKTGEWAKPDSNAAKFASVVQSLLGSLDWTTRKQGSAEVFESDWIEGNRFIKIFFRDRGDRVEISLATIRRVYGFPVVYETELLQRYLAGDRRFAALNLFQEVFYGMAGITEADADFNLPSLFPGITLPTSDLGSIVGTDPTQIGQTGNLGGNLTGSLTGGSNPLSGLGGTADGLNNLGSSINNATTTFGTTGNAIAGAGNNLAGAGNNIAGSINNLSGAGNNVAGSINNLSNTGNTIATKLTATGTQVTASMQNMSNSINGINHTIQQVASPRNAFLMGAAGVLGGIAAGAVVGFGADLAEKAVSSLYYSVIGRLDPVTREKLKAKASQEFDRFEELSKDISDAEKDIDMQIGALGFASNSPAENLAQEAQRRVFDIDDRMHWGMDDLHALTSPAARQACESSLVDLENQENFYKEVQPVLSRAPDGLPGLCRDMNELFLRWAILDSELDNARNALLNKAQLFTADIADQVSDAYTPEASIRRQTGECNASMAHLADTAKNAEISQSQCMDEMSKQFGDAAITPELQSQISDYCLTQQQRNEALATQAEQLAATCQQMQAVQGSVPGDQAMIQGLSGARLRLNSMRQFFQNLGQGDCVQRTPAGICTTGPGQFTLMKDRIQRQWDSAVQACPDLQPLQLANKASLASMDALNGKQGPPHPKKPGFFGRAIRWFWHGLTSIWSHIF